MPRRKRMPGEAAPPSLMHPSGARAAAKVFIHPAVLSALDATASDDLRIAWLTERCAEDPRLRAAVEALVQSIVGG